jgi:hypothetical protein
MPIVAKGKDGRIGLDEADRFIEGRLEPLCRPRAALVIPGQGRLVFGFSSRVDRDFNYQLDPSLSRERGP